MVRKAERAQAAGVLVQAAVLTIHQVKRIIDEAGRAGSLFGDARARAMQSANRGEFLAVWYCFRTIRNLMVRDRLQGGRLEGMSKADEATVATIGSGAALGYVMAKSLDEADRKVLLVPWLRAVGEPPPSDDLVQLAVDDSRTRPTTASLPTTPADPGLRTSVQRSSNYPAPQRATRQPPPRTAAPRARASSRYVSDAQIGENFTVRQVVDGLCWMIAGIAAVVFGTQPEYSSVWVILIGIAAVIYGTSRPVRRRELLGVERRVPHHHPHSDGSVRSRLLTRREFQRIFKFATTRRGRYRSPPKFRSDDAVQGYGKCA